MTIPMIENWCDHCVNGATYNVDPLMMATLVADNVMGMGPFGTRSPSLLLCMTVRLYFSAASSQLLLTMFS